MYKAPCDNNVFFAILCPDSQQHRQCFSHLPKKAILDLLEKLVQLPQIKAKNSHFIGFKAFWGSSSLNRYYVMSDLMKFQISCGY